MKRLLSFVLAILLLLGSAFAMTEEEAKSRILALDEDALEAAGIIAYPSSDADGAFVVVMTAHNLDETTAGNFWYVTSDDALLLGSGTQNLNWGLIDSEPQVFYNTYYKSDGERRTRACVLLDGRVRELENVDDLQFIPFGTGCIPATVNDIAVEDNYAFLRLCQSGGGTPYLAQICGVEIDRERFLEVEGAREALNTVESSGYTVNQILYWGSNIYALNFSKNSKNSRVRNNHCYLYWQDDHLRLEGGWFGDDIGLHSGTASVLSALDVPVVQLS